jgi:excinuclease ABC subunit B
MRPAFKLVTDFTPRGDQPRAIEAICDAFSAGERFQCLLGVTGSGKTFTAANVIEHSSGRRCPRAQQDPRGAALRRAARALPGQRGPVLRQLLRLLPARGVRPSSDTFIEKDAIINDAIDRMRHAATHALLSRPTSSSSPR